MSDALSLVELAVSKAYNGMRERLENRFDCDVSNYGVSGADIVSNAFAYAAGYLIEKGEPFEEQDLENLLCSKARLLVRDVYRAAQRKNGRKSIKASQSLDDNDDEAKRGEKAANAVAYSEYRIGQYQYDRELLLKAERMVVDATMEKNKVTERNREVVRRIIFNGERPQVIADEYNMLRTTVDQLLLRVKRCVVKSGPAAILECYEMLEDSQLNAA